MRRESADVAEHDEPCDRDGAEPERQHRVRDAREAFRGDDQSANAATGSSAESARPAVLSDRSSWGASVYAGAGGIAPSCSIIPRASNTPQCSWAAVPAWEASNIDVDEDGRVIGGCVA